MGFIDRLQHGWNAFMNKDPTRGYYDTGPGYSYRPDRPRLTRGNERTIVTSIFNRIALDVAALNITHCKVDENGRYVSSMDSPLNNCLNLEANLDQTGRAFIQDVVISMFDEGCVAVVPVDTSIDPEISGSYNVESMRTGKILEWYPKHVKVRVYNENSGIKEDIKLPKSSVSIIENPLFAVVNEPNSTLQRLMRKLALLDVVDEQTSAGKLDMIIQLPYTIKSEARRTQAEARRKDIEMQLTNTKYGIAYVDATEKITQLNRPLENNLMKQIEYLTNMLYSQLGITQTILDGTADEQTLLNYHSRTIEPIVSAIVDEMKRKFLTKTARTQKQTITFFRDPFKLVPVNNIADIADKFTRNEVLTSNEIRQIIGFKPSADPKADELRNSNLNHPDENGDQGQKQGQGLPEQSNQGNGEYEQAMGDLDELDAQLDDLESSLPDESLKHYASPYYDPVKAHEYYMKNRELKGENSRKSTAGLNDEGKAIAKYVKNQLDTERKGKVEDHNNRTQAQINTNKANMNSTINANKENMNSNLDAKKKNMAASIETHKTQTTQKIEKLREELKGMSMDDWNKNAERIQSEIAKLREDNDTIRTKLQAAYSEESAKLRSDNQAESAKLRTENQAESTNLRNAHKTETARLKSEYEEKYKSELDKLKNDAKYIKVSKSSKSSTKS
nr:MAG TPA: portal protein [Caudoviricetes sp.]